VAATTANVRAIGFAIGPFCVVEAWRHTRRAVQGGAGSYTILAGARVGETRNDAAGHMYAGCWVCCDQGARCMWHAGA